MTRAEKIEEAARAAAERMEEEARNWEGRTIGAREDASCDNKTVRALEVKAHSWRSPADAIRCALALPPDAPRTQRKGNAPHGYCCWIRTEKGWRIDGNISRPAPIQTHGEHDIPWEVSAEAWKEYAAQGHGDQSHERLCERGGFGLAEVTILLYDRIKRLESLWPEGASRP